MRWPWSWWRADRGGRIGGRPARVVLYSRGGCHLCEDARSLLTEMQRHHGFALDVVDVDAAPGLAAQYGEWVPVVVIDGKERFRGTVNRALLARLLRRSAPS